jgi:hypothetical protein
MWPSECAGPVGYVPLTDNNPNGRTPCLVMRTVTNLGQQVHQDKVTAALSGTHVNTILQGLISVEPCIAR